MMQNVRSTTRSGRVLVNFRGALARPFPAIERLLERGEFAPNAISIARDEIAELARSHPDRVLFGRNTTEALSLVRWLAEVDGGSVVLSDAEYPSVARIFRERRDHGNTLREDDMTTWSDAPIREAWSGDPDVRPLRSVRVLRAPFLGGYDPESLIDRVAADTRLVVLSHAVRSTGRIVDIESFAVRLRKRYPELLLAVDGAFAFGNLPRFDFSRLEAAGVDFYAISPHKTLKSLPLGVLLLSQRATARIGNLNQARDQTIFRGMIPSCYGPLHTIQEGLHPGRFAALSTALDEYRSLGYLHENDFSAKIRRQVGLRQSFLERVAPLSDAIYPGLGGEQLPALLALRFDSLENRRVLERLREEGVVCCYIPEIDALRFCFDVEHEDEDVAFLCDRLAMVRGELGPGARRVRPTGQVMAAPCAPPTASVPALFARQVALHGTKTAVSDGSGELTYDELDRYTNRIARRLWQAGLRRGRIAAVPIPRSRESVATYLGILKCGAAYLPLHPDLPPERKRGMLVDAGVGLVCIREDASEEDYVEFLPEGTRLVRIPGPENHTFAANAVEDPQTGRDDEWTSPDITPDDGAYALYTSGSTGEPKGILVPHGGIERLLIQPNYFQPGSHLRMAHAASIAFDVSVFEIWGALLHGGTLIVVPDGIAAHPRRFAELIRSEGVNAMMLPPALLQVIATQSPGAFAGVQDLFYAGEPARPEFIARLLQDRPPQRLVNGYGLTEISVISTYHEIQQCDGQSALPIGQPISGSRLYVLDEELNLVGEEIAGELYIGGVGLAHGYLNRPGLTAERFLPDPYGEPGARMYRTGDLVRRDGRGDLVYIGRADRQIKIHGLRIEPGEIEHCLSLHSQVKEAAVRAMGADGSRIGAWVVPRDGLNEADRESLPDLLREFVGAKLPGYMMPTRCFLLNELPLSPNGKVNYRALPEDPPPQKVAAKTAAGNGSVASGYPRSPEEALLMYLFAEILEREGVGRTDNFLELGGDSLSAMRLAARVRDVFGRAPGLKEIFTENTPEKLARKLGPGFGAQATEVQVQTPPSEAFEPVAKDAPDPVPLSPAQRRIWFLDRLARGARDSDGRSARAAYHIPLSFSVQFQSDGRRELEILETALREIARRHEILRTVFEQREGLPLQRVLPVEAPGALPRLKRVRVSAPRLEVALRRLILAPFDLETEPALRAHFLHTKTRGGVLLIVWHHLVEDGWSVGLLLRELSELYAALLNDRPPGLAPLPRQFGDFARERRRLASTPEYGDALGKRAARFAGLESVELPLDRTRPEGSQDARGAELCFALSEATTRRLRRWNEERGVTMFTSLFTVFAVWLYRMTGREALMLATQTAGRASAADQNLIGFFADVQLLRADVRPEKSFARVLKELRDEIHEVLEHQDLSFDDLVQALKPERERARGPLFNQAFFFQEAAAMQPRLVLEGAEVRPQPLSFETVRMDLELHTYEEQGRIFGRCMYAVSLFDADTIAGFLAVYQSLLHEMLDRPDLPVADLKLAPVPPARRTPLDLPESAQEPPAYPEQCLVRVFEDQAALHPEAPALLNGEETIPYAELNQQSTALALDLIRKGVGPGDVVSVRLHRSPELVISWLGIMKAGAIYLPLDPDAPAERNEAILAEARPAVRLEAAGIRETLETARAFSAAELDVLSGRQGTLDDPAYIMYTSGSSGTPRGVLVSQRGMNRLVFGNDFAALGPEDRVAFASHVSFDASTFEVWAALAHGAAIVILSRETVLEPAAYAAALREYSVSTVFLTTALFNRIIAARPDAFAGLRHLLMGGERVDPAAVRRALEQGPAHFWHVYGPTENVTFSTAQAVRAVEDSARTVPIGAAIAGSRCYVLDPHGFAVPPGVPGELYVAGDGLAFGYLKDPARTAEKFVPNPFGPPGSRMYRTGDRVRERSDGALEFLGRVDRQLKLRGFRIEPGEIEQVLRAGDGVTAVAVKLESHEGEKELHAHFTGQVRPADLRARAAGLLPGYMVPARFFHHAVLPTAATGKIDYAALKPDAGEAKSTAVRTGVPDEELPTSAFEVRQRIRAVWNGLLKHDDFSDDTSFFQAGGHSLLLAKLLQRLQVWSPDMELGELFEVTTVAAQAARIAPAKAAEVATRNERRVADGRGEDFIALVGMSGRFPGAPDLDTFRANLYAGVESITRYTPAELAGHVPQRLIAHPDYVPAAGVLADEDLERFDAEFFGIPRRESVLLAPEDRLFIEECFRALQHAGYDPGRTTGAIGLYAGADPGRQDALRLQEAFADGGTQYPRLAATLRDFLCSRAAYHLNLTGPVLFIQTACSTSLVAVHTAARALLDGECDLALAGGVSLSPPRAGYLYQEGGILAPDGVCRAFDRDASGVVNGSGVGVVVLKRLSEALGDGDTIQAVLRGTAVVNDGADKMAFSAPSVAAQERVLRAAQERAGVKPEEVAYLEAHGTGTKLGDAVEVRALRRVFGEDSDCVLGSVKTNIGHASAAAGLAGLFKAVFALQVGRIPPTLNFKERNEDIFGSSRFMVNTDTIDWPRGKSRLAGVSSFGMGGTIAHAILEAPPPMDLESREYGPRAKHEADGADATHAPGATALLFSARTSAALDEFQARLIRRFEEDPELSPADAAFTLGVGRATYAHRRLVVARDRETMLEDLRRNRAEDFAADEGDETNAPDAIVFLFPGQGGQASELGRELFAKESGFRRHFEDCCMVLGAEPERLFAAVPGNDLAQAALFSFEYALARDLMDLGLQPTLLLGHSLGEYTAAAIAGVFRLEDVLPLLVLRERLMSAMPPGAMLTVFQEADRLTLPEGLAVSTFAPGATVVAGAKDAVEAYARRLEDGEITSRRLASARAYHTGAVAGMLEEFAKAFGNIQFNPPNIPLLSNAHGGLVHSGEVTGVDYWIRHTRAPVRLDANLTAVLERDPDFILELGPGRSLSAFLKNHQAYHGQPLFAARPDADEHAGWMRLLGRVALRGGPVDWSRYYAGAGRRRVPLPAHPLHGERYPFAVGGELSNRSTAPAATLTAGTSRPDFVVANAGAQFEEYAKVLREAGYRPIQFEFADDKPASRKLWNAPMVRRLGSRMELATQELKRARFYLRPEIQQRLNRLALLLVQAYFVRRLQPNAESVYSREDLHNALGVQPAFERYFRFFVGLLMEGGALVPLDENESVFRFVRESFGSAANIAAELRELHPGTGTLIELMETAAAHYDEIIAGRSDPLSLMYPDGTDSIIYSAMLRDHPEAYFTHYQTELIESAVEILKAAAGRGERPRVLEIGAGEGFLTWPLLEAAGDLELEYHFSDLGRMFLKKGRAEALRRGRTGMRFVRFDLNEDPFEQGLHGPYDLIFGLNVIHVAADVRLALKRLGSLLRPGGLLQAIECTGVEAWQHVFFGLLPGWWDFADDRTDSLLLNPAQWERRLREADFARTHVFPGPGLRASTDHALIVATKSAGNAKDPAPGEKIDFQRAAGVVYVRGTESTEEIQKRLADLAAGIPAQDARLYLVDSEECIPAGVLPESDRSDGPVLEELPRSDEPPTKMLMRALQQQDATELSPVKATTPDDRGLRERKPALPDPTAVRPSTASSASTLDHRLSEIWREALYVRDVGPESDFFAQGGDSMVAVHLVTRIRDVLGVRLKPADLLAHARFDRLAELIRTRADRSPVAASPQRDRILHPVREAGAGRPLFLVCPLDVSPLCYVPLGRSLDRPVFALKTGDLAAELDEITKVAERYIAAVRTAREDGRPWLIGGWSYGGIIAFEMARLLEERGEHAELVLLDAPIRDLRDSHGQRDFFAGLRHVLDVHGMALEYPLTMSPLELLRFLRGLGQRGAGEDLSHRAAYALPFLSGMLSPLARKRFLSILNYTPRTISAPTINVFVPRVLKQARDLSSLIEGPLENIESPGNHQTFLWPRYVPAFASRIESLLARGD